MPPASPPRVGNRPSGFSLAVTALSAGVVSWVLLALATVLVVVLSAPFLAAIGLLIVVAAAVTVALGHVALVELRKADGPTGHERIAVTGLILGYGQIVVVALSLVGACVFFAVYALLFGPLGD